MFLENTLKYGKQFGWIEVVCGSMFSGKTEELIRRLKRAKFAKLKVVIFKPIVDTRHKKSSIVSHDKNKIKCKAVKNANQIYRLAHKCDVVGIDEAQFFDDEIIEVCNGLANSGIRVIVAGLDMDYTGKPFGPMANLMATAEYVTKVHAICSKTGGLAQYSHRKTKNDDLIMLGQEQEYEPLCRATFFKRMNKKTKKINVSEASSVSSKKRNK
ncbi:MAG: thymidine kinase [Flavobacteriales bacterium]|nr:MAG: thymidine kinase [Flavobacteriales bacterium]